MPSAGSPSTVSRPTRATDIDTASLKRRFPHLAGVETADIRIDGPHGRLVPARLYRDAAAPASGRALVWVHGGAFIGGYLDMPEANWVALELAARGIPVLSVDYVKCLGDVHFPEPTDEVRTAWEHARAHAEELFGVDADAVLLGGASAGGNLTAGAVAQLQDAGDAGARRARARLPRRAPERTRGVGRGRPRRRRTGSSR